MNEKIWAKSCHISPSMITLDMCNLEQQCRMVEEAGLEMIPCRYSGQDISARACRWVLIR